jgi:uncharacterized protein
MRSSGTPRVLRTKGVKYHISIIFRIHPEKILFFLAVICYITLMNDLISSFLLNKKIGVVGSFKDVEKYAYVIVKELVSHGYEPVPVNPHASLVENIRCYPRVSDLPDDVLAVDIVTPPDITRGVLDECLSKGIRYVWIQPGAESREAIDFCTRNGISVIHDACILTSLAEQ